MNLYKPQLNKTILLHFIIFIFSTSLFAQNKTEVTPLPLAHSHNDYERKKPLKEALEHGFTSIEADVLFVYGRLLVGHNMPNRRFHGLKTLSRQYLRPLYRRWKRNDGEIYPGYKGDFYLWIDIKFEPKQSYHRLREILIHFKEMLNYYENGKFHKGKVTVILSGERPFDELLNDTLQLMTLDGRPGDLGKNYPTELMPFISERADKIAGTTDSSKINQEVIERIKTHIEKVHAQGKKVRLWATPEDKKVWGILIQIGIDLINTDHLTKLRNYLLQNEK